MDGFDVERDEAERVEALSGELKAMFDTIAAQPVPEHLTDLVEALEEKRLYRKAQGEDV